MGAAALAFLLPTAAEAAAEPPKPLFAGSEMIHVTITGPISAIARNATESIAPHPASLSLGGAAEVYPIMLSARGKSRRNTELCQFPPLRVEFTRAPDATSLFRGQKRLKLVTHCRQAAGFQQYLLLEYATYQLFNVLTPVSFRARLATVDYVDTKGRPVVSRLGYFLEDADDAARRVGLREVAVGDRISTAQLSAREAARLAVFEYMIGNLDWSTRAGAAGTGCCHNAKLLGTGKTSTSNLVSIPYDFDHSGFVDAPYALPPEKIPVSNVRRRYYRGWCIHNSQALVAAAEMRTQRAAMLAVLDQIPQIEERTRRSAAAYLDGFFKDIATDRDVTAKLLKTCIN
jgi:hypothetical protein